MICEFLLFHLTIRSGKQTYIFKNPIWTITKFQLLNSISFPLRKGFLRPQFPLLKEMPVIHWISMAKFRNKGAK